MIANPCPRDSCRGSIQLDGTCSLCTRSVGEPVAEPKPRHIPKVDPTLNQDWSVKCRYGEHMACRGRRFLRTYRGSTFAPCMCPHHGGAVLGESENKVRKVKRLRPPSSSCREAT